MKNEDILKAVGQVDDSLVEESDIKEEAPKAFRLPKKKWMGAVAAVLALAVVLYAVPNLLGGAKSAAPMQPYDSGLKEERNTSVSYFGKQGMSAQYDYGLSEGESINKDVPEQAANQSVYNKSDVKLIYTATINAQTTEYDKSEAELEALVDELGGYFESRRLENYASSQYTYKTGNYTIRIPADKYNEFIEKSGDSCTVTSLSENVKDVGLTYSEIEQRLESLYIKEDRLQELLKEATKLEDIITLENALSSTEYEIESYKSNKNRYDSLIGYSTITLYLSEVARPDGSIGENNGFFQRLWKNFKDGLSNTASNIEDFFIWVSYNFVTLIVAAIVIFLLIKFRPIRAIFRKLRKKD